MNSLKRQRGAAAMFTAFFLIAVSSGIMLSMKKKIDEERVRNAVGVQAHRLISISTAIERFINDGDLTGTDNPLNQHNVAGEPFENGAEHIGIDWLRENCVSGTGKDYIDCKEYDIPTISHGLQYRSVIENDGDDIKVTLYVEDATDPKIGVTTDGVPDKLLALQVIDSAEAKSNITNNSSTIEYFDVPDTRGMAVTDPNYRDAVIVVTISYESDSTPFIRQDGRKTWKGDQVVETGRDVDLKNLTDLELTGEVIDMNSVGIQDYKIDLDGFSKVNDLLIDNTLDVANDATLNSNLFVGGSAIIAGDIVDPNSAGAANYKIEWDNESKLKRLKVAETLTTDNFIATNDSFFGGNVNIDATKSLELTSMNLLGNAFIHGVLADPSLDYFFDMDGISRFEDISIGAAGDGLLSERLSPYSMIGAIIVKDGDLIPKPVCTNGEPKIILNSRTETHSFGDGLLLNYNQNFYFKYVESAGLNWRVKLQTVNMATGVLESDVNGEVVASIYCYYY
ncbi:hypothetical protein [Photobacterium leiognathi]|uniref:hypothetical protein n=1 Tax=Photobacterium leiognathi TaxID=553611 RepID=UPI002981CE35|nr:hypothetical protein [Photobacterium leiognathi]